MSKVLITKSVITATATAFADAAKIEGQAQETRNMAVQKVVDLMTIKRGTQSTKDFLKGNASTNAARLAVNELFAGLVERGLIKEASTAKTYATCFWIAFTDNVSFSTDLANQKSKAKKAREAQTGNGLAADKTATKKAGKVETTDRAALLQTLTKAFEQSQILIKAGDTDLTTLGATLDALVKQFTPSEE
jgi:general stress protein CsbA